MIKATVSRGQMSYTMILKMTGVDWAEGLTNASLPYLACISRSDQLCYDIENHKCGLGTYGTDQCLSTLSSLQPDRGQISYGTAIAVLLFFIVIIVTAIQLIIAFENYYDFDFYMFFKNFLRFFLV